jgi:LytS/YehU family sensor histidine kinase
MILQPLVENAYTHGLSKLDSAGVIAVSVRRERAALRITILNSGLGLRFSDCKNGGRQCVGIANVKDRLRLHYGNDQTFVIEEVDEGQVQVTITMPLQFSDVRVSTFAGYGA